MTEGKLPAHCSVLYTLVAGGEEKGQNDKRSRGEELVKEKKVEEEVYEQNGEEEK